MMIDDFIGGVAITFVGLMFGLICYSAVKAVIEASRENPTVVVQLAIVVAILFLGGVSMVVFERIRRNR